MKTIITIAAVLVTGFFSNVMATSYASPKERVVKSPNGKYSLDVNPMTGQHEVRKDGKLVWSFKRKIWHDRFFLSNDGQRVMWVAWSNMQEHDDKGYINRQADQAQQDQAIAVYSPAGMVLKKTFAEMGKPRKRVGRGPIGDFWRWNSIAVGECLIQCDPVILAWQIFGDDGKSSAIRINFVKDSTMFLTPWYEIVVGPPT